MTILGLGPGAQVIVLQALATYAAIGSAFCFARPVLRGQATQAQRDILASTAAAEPDVAALLARATDVLARKAQGEQPRGARDNRIGLALLVLSLALFTAAVAMQVASDPAFAR
jgi:hypothetical protein